VCSASGQFTVWGYIAPLVKFKLDASPTIFSGLLVWMGGFGLIGNLLAARAASRTGPALTVHAANASMALGLVGLMFVGSSLVGFALCCVLWGLGIFAGNSSQQARLAGASPELAGASIALNTSMIYLGQAIGTSIGGAVIATSGYAWLPLIASVVLVGALALSLRASSLDRQPQAVI
jgi:predicted MFS family arabinose efflux permease